VRVVPDLAYFPPDDAEHSLISSLRPTEFSQFIMFISEKSGCQIASDVMQEASGVEDRSFLIGAITAAVVIATLLAARKATLSEIWNSKWTWTAAILPLTYYLICGAMWSRIRRGAFYGGTRYFSSGVASQFGIETRIIGVIYFVISLMLMLTPKIVAKLKDANRKRVAALALMSCVMVGQSLIVHAFQLKVSDYPVKYLF